MTKMYFVRIKEYSSGKGTNDYDRTYRLSLSHVTIVCKKKTNITRSTPNRRPRSCCFSKRPNLSLEHITMHTIR